MKTLSELAPVLPLIVAAIAAATFLKAVVEYIEQIRLRKFATFQEMSRRFDENEDISRICELLMDGSNCLAEIGTYKKEIFICFMEEIAVLYNSGILSRILIFNSFGYYAIQAHNSAYFWQGLDRNRLQYQLFVDFCRKMAEAEKTITPAEIKEIRIARFGWLGRIPSGLQKVLGPRQTAAQKDSNL